MRLGFIILVMCLVSSLFVVAASDHIFFDQGQTQTIDGHGITLVDVYSDGAIELRVDQYQQRVQTRNKWYSFGDVEVELTGVFNHLYDVDQASIRVKGYAAEDAVVAEEVEVVEEVDLYAGEAVSYGGHEILLRKTSDTHAYLVIDGVEEEVRKRYSVERGPVAIFVDYVITNSFDESLDMAGLKLSGGETVEEVVVELEEPAEEVEYEPFDSEIRLEPTPEEVVFAGPEEVAEDEVEETVEEVAEDEGGFFSKLFRALFGAFMK